MNYVDVNMVRNALKELFESGDVEISTDFEKDYHETYLITRVRIDDEEVYENKEQIFL